MPPQAAACRLLQVQWQTEAFSTIPAAQAMVVDQPALAVASPPEAEADGVPSATGTAAVYGPDGDSSTAPEAELPPLAAPALGTNFSTLTKPAAPQQTLAGVTLQARGRP